MSFESDLQSRRKAFFVDDKVVAVVRDLLGPTDSRKAPKGTIRGDFGTEMMKNVVHASDSEENGLIEIARFFRADEVYA